jgi:hypothetical protein
MQELRYVDTAVEKLTKTVSRWKFTTMEMPGSESVEKTLSRLRKSPESVSRQGYTASETRMAAANRKRMSRERIRWKSVARQGLGMIEVLFLFFLIWVRRVLLELGAAHIPIS